MDQDNPVTGTTSDEIIKKMQEDGEDFAREYLKASFLVAAANTLFAMRRQSGLTQAQVAERMKTKQPAIPRWEGDFEGSMSLRQYVDFALACSMVPHSITFAPLEDAMNYTIDHPQTLYTEANYQEWLKKH